MAWADIIRRRPGWPLAMRAGELCRTTRLGPKMRVWVRVQLLLASAALLMAPTASAKPSDHSYSLIRIYTPRAGSEQRAKILDVAMRGGLSDRGERSKILTLRAAILMDPQIWETDDWSIAFLRYRYPAYDGASAHIGYRIVTADEAGEWTLRWSMNDGGSSRSCEELFDHLVEARKFIARRGLDPKKFAPELLPLERTAELTMREYKGVCAGDF